MTYQEIYSAIKAGNSVCYFNSFHRVIINNADTPYEYLAIQYISNGHLTGIDRDSFESDYNSADFSIRNSAVLY